MSKHGINVPKGFAVSSVDELKKAIQDVFPNEKEVILGNPGCYRALIYFVKTIISCCVAEANKFDANYFTLSC